MEAGHEDGSTQLLTNPFLLQSTSLAPFDTVVCGPLDKLCCAWWAKRAEKKKQKSKAPSRHDLEVAASRIGSSTVAA